MYVSKGIYGQYLLLLKPLIEDIRECDRGHIIRLGLAANHHNVISRSFFIGGYLIFKYYYCLVMVIWGYGIVVLFSAASCVASSEYANMDTVSAGSVNQTNF